MDICAAVVPQHGDGLLIVYTTRQYDFFAKRRVVERFHNRAFILFGREVADDNQRLCARAVQIGVDDRGDMLIRFKSSYNKPVFMREEISDSQRARVFTDRARIPGRGDGLIDTVGEENDFVLVPGGDVRSQLLVINDYVPCTGRGESEKTFDNVLLYRAELGSLPFEPAHVEHHFFSQESRERYANVCVIAEAVHDVAFQHGR